MAFQTMEELGAFLKNKPILVANRGIPARRICRSIRERFHAVAVMTATDVDKTSPAASSGSGTHAAGSRSQCLSGSRSDYQQGKNNAASSPFNPGWGFASEDESFPRKCAEAGIIFIGSTAESMNLLGNKVQARQLAIESWGCL